MHVRLDEILHDYELWGHALSSDPTPQALIRVAELVRINVNEQTPLREAAANVIAALRSLTPERWFLLQRASRAEALAPGDLWCPPPRTCLPTPNWATRPLRAEPSDWVRICAKSEWAQFEPDPKLQGFAGLLQCLQDDWSRLQQRSDLDRPCLAARIAMLGTDAQHIVDSLQGDVPAMTRHVALPTAQWTDEELLFAVSLHRDKFKSYPDIAVAMLERFGREVSPQRVGQKIREFKEAQRTRSAPLRQLAA